MKERKQITLILGITLTAAISIVGCKSKEKTITKELENRGEVEIVEHCSGESYFSNNKYFRANATGESLDRETAKKKALSNAMADLAKSVSAIMKIVGDNYVNSTEYNNKEEITESFNELARIVVNEEISGAVKICDKLTQKNDKRYVSYIAIELSGQKIATKYHETLSKDEKIKADYNYEKFKETFEKEMKKLGNL
jgi:hypothetical protein|tara:strand:+ start:4862 stop:5452 length:591 start_codon:yes stop_codon:yes gene_type:complete